NLHTHKTTMPKLSVLKKQQKKKMNAARSARQATNTKNLVDLSSSEEYETGSLKITSFFCTTNTQLPAADEEDIEDHNGQGKMEASETVAK
ncbi:6456_t:CDS:2, partial [Cetraspora pellucida]